MEQNNKGALFYTLIGLMVIALVAVIALHILRTTYSPSNADEIRLQRFTNAIYGTQAELQTLARYSEYPAVWKAGHNIGPDGINFYLTTPDGRKELKSDLIKDFTLNLNKELAARSGTNASTYYTLYSDEMPITINEIKQKDVSLRETEEGLLITVQTHLSSKYKDYNYEQTTNITTDVPARIFQMYDKAKTFHENYDPGKNPITPVRLFSYGMTWGRAYKNAYGVIQPNTLLIKEGYYTYDPIDQLLSGDKDALQNFKTENLEAWGSIPIATAYSEWIYLGEPAMLPPGIDPINSETDLLKDYMANNLDLEKINKEIQQQDPSAKVMTEDELRKAAKQYNDAADKIDSAIKEIDEWEKTTVNKKNCKEFKQETGKVLGNVLSVFKDREFKNAEQIKKSGDSTKDSTSSDDFIDHYTDPNREQIKTDALKQYLDEIDNNTSSCLVGRLGAVPDENTKSCSCNHECGGDTLCGDCGTDGADYSWDRDCNKKDCCIEEDKEGKCTKSDERCSDCECNCEILSGFIIDIKSALNGVSTQLSPQIEHMRAIADTYTKQADNIRDLRNTVNNVKTLDTGSDKYDVRSRINYSFVQYTRCLPLATDTFLDLGNNAGECYNGPTWGDVNKGVCGDVCTSGSIYGAQIAAAMAVSVAIDDPSGQLVQLAYKWFPVVYDARTEYKIDESLIDDKNRVMLHNLFAGDDDLYGSNMTPKLFTHVAPEFVIYQNHTIKSGDVFVVVYVNLANPAESEPITRSMSICEGDACTS